MLLYRCKAHPPSTLCHCHLPSGWQGVTWSDGSVGELNNNGINADDGSDGGQEEFNHYKRPRQWWVPKRRWFRSAMIIPTTDASCWQWFFVHRATTCQGEEGVSNGRTGSKRNFLPETLILGKLGDFFLLDQSFYPPQTKRSLKRQFSQKSPEVGQKSGQKVKNSRNKNQTANSGQQLL